MCVFGLNPFTIQNSMFTTEVFSNYKLILVFLSQHLGVPRAFFGTVTRPQNTGLSGIPVHNFSKHHEILKIVG